VTSASGGRRSIQLSYGRVPSKATTPRQVGGAAPVGGGGAGRASRDALQRDPQRQLRRAGDPFGEDERHLLDARAGKVRKLCRLDLERVAGLSSSSMSIAPRQSARHIFKPPLRSLKGSPSARRDALQPPRLSARRVALPRRCRRPAGSASEHEPGVALAGTGKTFTAGTIHQVYEDAGYHVIGIAPTGRAVRELAEEAGIAAWTIDRALLSAEQYDDAFASKTVIVFDEAGMASTRRTERLLALAAVADAKVIAIGDSGQLASVQAGGWLRALGDRVGAHQLTQVMRQRDAGERAALARLHAGDPPPTSNGLRIANAWGCTATATASAQP
jgi:hypothetical protein